MPDQTDGIQFGVDRVVTARARKLARQYLAPFKTRGGFLNDVPALLQQTRTVAEELAPAFAEAMDQDDAEERVFAAWFVLQGAKGIPRLVSRKTYTRASSVIVDALNHADQHLRLLASLLVSTTGAPSEALRSLEKQLVHPAKLSSVSIPVALGAVAAAVAICRIDGTQLAAHGVLRSAVRGDDHLLAIVASIPLLQMGLWSTEVAQRLRARLPQLNEDILYFLLGQLKLLGTAATDVFDGVAALLADRTVIPVIRGSAAEALGAIGRGTGKEAEPLLKAVRSSNWQVVLGALEGLHAGGDVPSEVAVILTPRLTDPDVNMRGAAAFGIGLLGERATVALPMLLRRLGEEDNADVRAAVIKALGRMGPAAADGLVAIIRDGDAMRMEGAMLALAEFGEEGANTLAELLPTLRDNRAYKMLVMVFGVLGKRAAAAVDVLARTLDETQDDEVAFHAAMSLWMCGPWALPAIPTLVRCVAERGSDEIGGWAERTLWSMREHAVPALQAAMAERSEEERENIEEALGRLGSWDDGAYAYLDRVSEELTNLFIAVGDILGDTAMARREIARIARERVAKGEVVGIGKSLSDRSIDMRLRKFEDAIGRGDLIEHTGDSRKKGGLTPLGKKMWAEANEYMRRKALRRKHEH